MEPKSALDALRAGAAKASKAPKRNSCGQATKAPSKAARLTVSSFSACPVCSRSFHTVLLPAHAAACTGAEEPPPPKAPPALPSSAEALPPKAAPAQPSASQPAGGDAFAHLLASAAARQLQQTPSVFSLRLLSDGSVVIAWGSPGDPANASAPTVWRERLELRDKSAPGGKLPVLLCTSVPSDAAFDWGDPHVPGEGRCRLAAGPLKSCVQKAVRRGLAKEAVRAAAALARLDPNEALRRLCIIVIEDAMLSPDLPLLSWLMAAVSKGYQPPAGLWAAVLRSVHALAALPVRDPPAEWADTGPLSLGAPPVGLAALPCAQAMLVRCILLRTHFGGMPSDMRMLCAAAAVWTSRFSGEAPPPLGTDWHAFVALSYGQLPSAEHCDGTDDSQAEVQLANIQPLRARDVPPAAIDFHCSNIVNDVMADGGFSPAMLDALGALGEPTEVLKGAMWRFRSGVSLKQVLGRGAEDGAGDDAVGEVWRLVAPLVEHHAARLIRRGFAHG